MKKALLGLGLLLMSCASTAFDPDKLPQEVVKLKVAGMTELDGKSAEEIHTLRDQALRAEPKLLRALPPNYKAAKSTMLSGVESGRPWVGAAGWACSDKASFDTHYADGETIDSVVIANPWMLVGLKSARVCVAWSPDMDVFWPSEIVPARLSVDGKSRHVTCFYQWRGTPPSRMVLATEPDADIYMLNTANANDFGLKYCRVVQNRSQNVRVKVFDRAMDCRMTYGPIAVDGHPDVQVNGLSFPATAYVGIKIDTLPVKLYLELHKNPPTDAQSKPTITEEIIIGKPT